MFKPSKGYICSAIICTGYSAISEYTFHRLPFNKER